MNSKKRKIIFPDEMFVAKRDQKIVYKSVCGDDTSGYAAFAVDATNEKQVAKAKDWAKGPAYGLYGRSVIPTPYSEYKEKNVPKTVRLIGPEYRSSNVVFKVLTEDELIFDLRDDEAMYVIRKYGVSAGGEINTKFLWSIRAGHMRLCQMDRINEILVEDILT